MMRDPRERVFERDPDEPEPDYEELDFNKPGFSSDDDDNDSNNTEEEE